MATGGCHQPQQQQQHGEGDHGDDDPFDTAKLNEFDYVRFTLTDMNGIGRCLSLPRRHVDHYLHEGLGFYAGTLHLPGRLKSFAVVEQAQAHRCVQDVSTKLQKLASTAEQAMNQTPVKAVDVVMIIV